MNEPALELDMRTLSPVDRHPALVGNFDTLQPGEAFVLIHDQDPQSFRLQLELERSGQFEWTVLEIRADRCRVRIGRRPDAAPRAIRDLPPGESEPAGDRELDDLVRRLLAA